MAYGLGVDLGTTRTAAGVWIDGRVEVANLGGQRPEMPSLVFVRDDGDVLVGDAAERRGTSEPARLAREFKRRLGDPVPILVGGSPYSAHALMARLLRYVLDTVSSQQQAPPAAVTVTYPANWGPYKLELLHQAVRLAEVENVTFRPEPEAAAVHYAAGERVSPGEVVAVYDLGGGTFDAAVLRKTEAGFELLGEPEGIEQLGGIDFDEAVFAHVIRILGDPLEQLNPEDEGTTTALIRLRRDCVEAKEGLSYDTEVMIPVALPNLHTRIRLNRSELETMITPALMETVNAMRRALRSAGVAPAELKSILLAGGSSRIPLVGQLLGAQFDRPVAVDPHPEHSIALGAALLAGPAGSTYSPPPPPGAAPPPGGAPPRAPAPVPGATPVPAVTGLPSTPPRTLVSRRTLIVGVPALALVGASVGILAATVNGSEAGKGNGNPSGQPSPSPSPSPSVTPTPPPSLPTNAMLIRVSQRSGGSSSARNDIYRTTVGSGRRELVVGSGTDSLPRLSHDRRRVAFTRQLADGYQAWIVGISGDNATLVTDRLAGGRVSWSPDGKRLAFRGAVDDRPQLFTIVIGESEPTQLTESAEPLDDPAWSPQGDVIAIWRRLNNQSQLGIIPADEPGAKWTQLTFGRNGAADPAWSPDGRRIAYTCINGQGPSDIWIVNRDGTGNRSVTTGPTRDMDPTWSPDGAWIAFTRGPLDAPAIYAVRPDGTGLRKITVGNVFEGHPCWS
ncbi:MAG TPA: Hsp70 family protein [Pilimelia sp.]|nr:Hsp70 family protein [Pilimelia sp.]